MTSIEIGVASILGILILIYTGMHVSIALALLSFLGVWLIKGNVFIAAKMLGLAASDSISIYDFGVVPLFVLMGMFVSVSEIGKDMFEVADRLFHRLRGGLGIATVAANAVFAAVTGISIASAAVFTKVAVPEMIHLGYRPRFAVGVVTGSSVLGMLIPPSLLFIIFGILTETSIGDLFKAGIVPGIVLCAAYSVMIITMAYRFPNYVTEQNATRLHHDNTMSIAVGLWKMAPVISLVILVLGGIYAGIFTPTESGAVGALGAGLLALGKGRLSVSRLWTVLVETGNVTVSILFLIIAANMYSRMLALSGVTNFLGQWITEAGLGHYGFIFLYMIVVLFLGTIIDSSSILMIVVPLVYPLILAMQMNLVWFGVVTVLAVEIGLLTPPFGIAAFVVKSTLEDQGITLNDVFIGTLPYVGVMLVVLILCIIFPQISLLLVR